MSIAEIKIIINNAKIAKLKCFEKKNNNLYLIVHLLRDEVEENEKNKPRKKSKKKT